MIDRRRLGWGPWVFVAMFAVILAANGIMMAFAFTSWTGLETLGAYDKGIAYNRTLEAARAQRALGWQVESKIISTGGQGVRIEISLRDRQGAAVRLDRVRARLIRPTHSGHDTTVTLAKRAAGRYGADLVLPLRGQWDLLILAEHPGGVYQARRRVVIE